MPQSAAVARRVFGIDINMLSWITLRPIKSVNDLAKTGDALKGALRTEGCLKVKSEKGLAVIADVFGLTAST